MLRFAPLFALLITGCSLDLDALQDGLRDGGPDADIDAGPATDAGPLGPDASLDAGLDAGPDAGVDAGSFMPGMVAAIDADGDTTCALTLSGQLFCWGDNSRGQLRVSPIKTPSSSTPRLMEVPGVSGWTGMAVGPRHVCAITNEGPERIFCWGDGTNGQTGMIGANGPAAIEVSTPAGYAGASVVTAGDGHTCALFLDDASEDPFPFCWGRNLRGQLGNLSTAGSGPPQPVFTGAGIEEIAAGGDFTCARTGTNEVLCWGDDSLGQVGSDASPLGYHDQPQPVGTGAEPTVGDALVVGPAHACAFRARELRWSCWGSNGAMAILATADPVVDLPSSLGRSDIEYGTVLAAGHDLATGRGFTCVTIVGGRTECRGAREWGQHADGAGVCDGSTPSEQNFTSVDVPAEVTAVAAGSRHTCWLLNGAVLCTGANDLGQLGVPAFMDNCRNELLPVAL